MKILLIDAINLWITSEDQDLDHLEQIVLPIGLMYLASYAQNNIDSALDFKIVNYLVDLKNADGLEKELDQFNPQIVGVRGINIFSDLFHEITKQVKATINQLL